MKIDREIIKEAESLVGIREFGNNAGFDNKQFEEDIRTLGWRPGMAWCVFFAMRVWIHVYARHNSLYVNRLKELFTPNAYETFLNFNESIDFNTGLKPMPGSIAIWIRVKNKIPVKIGDTDYIQGHAGLVVKGWDSALNEQKTFKTAEGNTNALGSRNGDVSAYKFRKPNFKVTNGLRPLGFIYPAEV